MGSLAPEPQAPVASRPLASLPMTEAIRLGSLLSEIYGHRVTVGAKAFRGTASTTGVAKGVTFLLPLFSWSDVSDVPPTRRKTRILETV